MSEDEKNHSTEQSGDGSQGSEGTEDVGISDDQLPEDLQPTDDNPLAKPLSEDDDEKGISLGADGPQT